MQRLRATPIAVLLLLAAMALASCGDDGGDDEKEIADVIKRAVTTTDVKVECEETVTDDFVQRIYGDAAQCRKAERPEPGEDEADDARVSKVKVDGDSATARVVFVGGDTDGASGSLELRKEDGDWRVDDLGVDLLRSTVNTGLDSESQEEPALRRPAVRSCAKKAFADLSDDELKRVAYAAISEREGGNAELGRLLAPCLAASGSGSGAGDVSFLREKFEEGVTRSLRRRGASQATIDCIVRRLRTTISDEQIAAAAARRQANARLRRLGEAAARSCR